MSRDRKWARLIAQEFLLFFLQMHNHGVSVGEIYRVFSEFDSEDPEDDDDFIDRTIDELLA